MLLQVETPADADFHMQKGWLTDAQGDVGSRCAYSKQHPKHRFNCSKQQADADNKHIMAVAVPEVRPGSHAELRCGQRLAEQSRQKAR